MITVYTKPNCVQCTATKNYLDARGIEYNTIDIVQDPDAFDTLIEKGFKAAPVVNIGDEWFAGFQPDRLDYYFAA
jgi:glutaredoxin-like protein NrdH